MNAPVIGAGWTASASYEVTWRDRTGTLKRMTFSTLIGAERYARFLSFSGLSGRVVVGGEALL